MKINDEILINKFGQSLINDEVLVNNFNQFDIGQKRSYLNNLANLIVQSKVSDKDIEPALINSQLKDSYTPSIMLKKGVANHNIMKIIQLPEAELNKVLILLINLFKIGYQRRFLLEKDDPNKWWYWDLSDNRKIEMIQKSHK